MWQRRDRVKGARKTENWHFMRKGKCAAVRKDTPKEHVVSGEMLSVARLARLARLAGSEAVRNRDA